MRAVFGLVLVVGIGLAGFAVMMVKDFLAQQAVMAEVQAAPQTVPTKLVYVAKSSLKYDLYSVRSRLLFCFLAISLFLNAVKAAVFFSLSNFNPHGRL